jgi:hypothetical protein
MAYNYIRVLPHAACTYCKKYGPRCRGGKWCLYSYQSGPPYLASNAPDDKSRIIRRVWDRPGKNVRLLGSWLVEREVHPDYKKKKPFLRNNVRQKRKERGKINTSPR